MSAAEMTPAQVAARVAQIIRNHPERWRQDQWISGDEEIAASDLLASLTDPNDACGTTCCVAGWTTVAAAPAESVIDADWGRILIPDRPPLRIEDYAADVLGLDREADEENGRFAEALGVDWWLFDPLRTREEVLAELDRIADGRS